MELEPATLDALRRRTGEMPRRITSLGGATSSRLFRVTLQRADVVLRLFLPERWENPPDALSRRELSILRTLKGSDMPTPEPIARLPGNGVVMGFLPGRVWLPEAAFSDWLDTMAAMLVRVHACAITVPYRYDSWNDTSDAPAPDWWQDQVLWSTAQQLADSPPDFASCFIHRDYHPLNLLWDGDRITGVVDWINACMGPPGIDVAHCRLNLALMYGPKAADSFLSASQHHAPGYRHHPYWDLDDALGALPDVEVYPPWVEFGLTGLSTDLVRTRLETFVAAAVAA